MNLTAGYAQDVITPTLDRPVYLAGFGRNRRAVDVHDDLYVRALALSSETQRIALVALDLIGLARHHCQEIERRVASMVGRTDVIVACTHTHHGPDTIGLWGPDESTSGVDPEYLAMVKTRIIQTILAAFRSAAPLESVKSTHAPAPGVVQNFRNPTIVDDDLTCIQFHVAGERALATLLIFPCHPEVLWDDNPYITSDYVHSLRQCMEEVSAAPCLVFVGALGGMLSPLVEERTFVAADHMGRIIAQAGHAALNAVFSSRDVSFSIARAEFAIPMTNPLFIMAMERGLLPNILDDNSEVLTETTLIAIGDVWLATNPGELLPRLGLMAKRALIDAGARVPAIIGLANDELGYILPADEFIFPDDPFNPGDHYEESMSIGAAAGPAWQNALETLIRSLRTSHSSNYIEGESNV